MLWQQEEEEIILLLIKIGKLYFFFIHRMLIDLMFRPLISSPKPKIFDPPMDKSMTIQFKVIVPLDVWEWEDDTSSIYLRFFTPKLSGRDIGPGHVHRYLIYFCHA